MTVEAKIERAPFCGIPEYDLDRAITDPKNTFHSPQEVALTNEIGVELRNRILQTWEYDIRAGMAEENEGGPVQDIDVNVLAGIRNAKIMLRAIQRKSGNGRNPTLGVAPR